MVDLEQALTDLMLPLVDDKASLSVKEMSSLEEDEILLHVYAKSRCGPFDRKTGFDGECDPQHDVGRFAIGKQAHLD